ncbi:hypothetical protein D917_06947 [Trichinella nativa]|uniref:Uncharacterized protein n=1 Tax=Trichinella nativa TaxID=6335 RepID=A0A1Y3EV82_9BILA|nr:hypothetical protein D917_06947 [Trichinella nativa]
MMTNNNTTSKLEAQLNAVDNCSEKSVNSERKYEKKKAESKPIENRTFGRGDNFFFKRNDPRLLGKMAQRFEKFPKCKYEGSTLASFGK